MSLVQTEIPPLFLEQMRCLLGEEYAAFAACMAESPRPGLRVNTLKISVDDFRQRSPFSLKELPWCPSGFLITPPKNSPSAKDAQPGRHPYHAAGLYYLQEPSAMAVAEVLDPKPGEHILDLCAAPGGKATHIASLMCDSVVLVANEIHPRRVWELVENLERWGIHNSVVTCESPRYLSNCFAGFFDRVLVDAPCSGEAMFRKSEAARRDWSPALVRSCARRQADILENAARLVRPGGVLAYSTCSFNPQENEQVIATLVRRFSEFRLRKVELLPGMSPGRPEWLEEEQAIPELRGAVRFWPHHTTGEGHFIALLQREPSDQAEKHPKVASAKIARSPRRNAHALSEALRLYQEFCNANLCEDPTERWKETAYLDLLGTRLYLVPLGLPKQEKLRIIRPGWFLGTVKKGQERSSGYFEPSHALAMGIQERYAQQVISLPANHPQVLKYLRGEAIEGESADGWILVTVDGHPLGWEKKAKGRYKNCYPRGLRWL